MADNSNNTRVSREQETRAADIIHEDYDDVWEENDILSTRNIQAREGYVQRWVRTMTRGQEDQSNVFNKMNKGWKARLSSSVPKGQFIMTQNFSGQEVIGVHGMILMERPMALQNREKRAVAGRIDLQMRAVQENMYGVHDPRSGLTRPSFDLKEKTTVGRSPIVDD